MVRAMPRSKLPKPISGKRMEGVLMEPIDLPPRLLVALLLRGKSASSKAEGHEMVFDYVEDQLNERLNALRTHYGLPSDSYPGWEKETLVKLAEDFVLGFRSKQEGLTTKPGRKVGTTEDQPVDLLIAFQELIDKGQTVLRASEILVGRSNSPWKDLKPTALKARYERAIKSLVSEPRKDERHNSIYSRLRALPDRHPDDA